LKEGWTSSCTGKTQCDFNPVEYLYLEADDSVSEEDSDDERRQLQEFSDYSDFDVDEDEFE